MPDPSLDGSPELEALEARGIDCAAFFDGQFVFSPNGVARFDSWTRLRICGGVLQISPALPNGAVCGPDGRPIGHRLGVAIAPGTGLLQDGYGLPCDPQNRGAVEDWAATLAGRFLLLLDLPSGPCVIGDPVGDLGLVYCPGSRRAAATLSASGMETTGLVQAIQRA